MNIPTRAGITAIVATIAILIATLTYSCTAKAEEQTRPAPELSLRQKLVVAEAAVALVTGPIALPVAILTGKQAEFCKLLEGRWVHPSSYNPNNDGRDQCPKGNWLRIIPFLSDKIPE